MFGRRSRRQRVRRTRRATLLRLVPLLCVTGVVAALLVAVAVSQLPTESSAGKPADVEKRELVVTPKHERAAYGPQDAALVAEVDPSLPTIQDGEVVAELSPHDLPDFELLGVTWTGGVPADVTEVQVRWQQDGRWSDWTILDPEEQAVDGGIPGTEPKWVGPSQAAQVRLVASADIDPTGLTLVTVAGGESPTLTQAATTQPAIISRAQWGARAYGGSGCGSAPANGTFKGTIIHHTAGANAYTAAQSAGIVRSAQAYHMDGQKWCDIGYNFLVDAYGQIFEGRAGGITNTPYGAHSGNSSVNASTTGIALMGTFTQVEPTQAAKDSVVRLTAWRHSLFGVPATGSYSNGGVTIQRIDGHYRVKSTACPGAGTIAWMTRAGGLRDQVAALIATGGGPSTAQRSAIDQVAAATPGLGGPVSDYVSIPGQVAGAGRQFANGSVYTSALGTFAVLEPVRSSYFGYGGSTGALGWPTSGPLTLGDRPNGRAQAFSGGSIYSSDATGTYAVLPPVLKPYFDAGGSSGTYGWPIAAAVNEAGGVSQAFDRARLYGSGGRWFGVPTAFDSVYREAGGPQKLGWPASNVLTYPGGQAQAFGTGSLYASSAGTFIVFGAHLTEYFRKGGSSGTLGWPTSAVSCNDGTCTQNFQNGQIVVDPNGVATTVSPIDAVATAERANLGARTSDIVRITQNGGGYGAAFERGSVYSSSRGAFAVYPPIRDLYFRSNGAAGSWGFPVGPRVCAGGSCYQEFANGVLTSTASGTTAVGHLGVEQAYARHGGQSGFLGAKTSGVLPIAERGGGVGQVFAGGSVYSGTPGSFAVSGPVRVAYWNQGGPVGRLGWPTADQTCSGTTCKQTFQGGTVTSTPSGTTIS